jgi:predicted RND superfamily exporter protein
VLALSSFTTVREFGWLSALTMQICLWGDLLMLPSILTRFATAQFAGAPVPRVRGFGQA